MSTEKELNKVLTAVREWSFQDLMAAEAMLTSESQHAEADDVSYAIGRKALADEAWLDLIARLRAILTELEAAREDAARWQEVAFGENLHLGVFYLDSFGESVVFEGQEAVDVVDAVRKGEA